MNNIFLNRTTHRNQLSVHFRDFRDWIHFIHYIYVFISRTDNVGFR